MKYLQITRGSTVFQTPAITFDEVIIDFVNNGTSPYNAYYIDARTGIAYMYIYNTSSGVDAMSASNPFDVYVNDILYTYSNLAVPQNQRVTMRLHRKNEGFSGTDNVNLFSQNNNLNQKEVQVYDVKFLLNGVLVAHYDMNTESGLDQSGNGNHATLTGGAWFDDGLGGGDTGTTGSTLFDVKQSIYRTLSQVYDIRNVINHVSSLDFYLEQRLFNISNTNYDTYQAIYETVRVMYDTHQEITDGGIIGSTRFDTRLVLYAEDINEFDTKQSYFTSGDNVYDLKQASYEASNMSGNVHLIIYSTNSNEFDTNQSLYASETTAFDTKQILFDEDTQLIGKIELTAKRNLYVYLIGKRDLYVSLKGGFRLTAENQNFSMTAGDTKYISFPVEDSTLNLSGCTVKWGVKKSKSSTEFELMKHSPDITIVEDKVQVKLNKEDTIQLLGTYFHEAQLTDQLGNESTVLKGMVTFTEGLIP